MRFIPTFCDACSSSTLTLTTRISAGRTNCQTCGGDARSIPGSSYASEDRALYQTFADALLDAGLAPVNAGQLLVQLDSETLESCPGQALRFVSRSLPALAELELLLSEEGYDDRKGEGMLVTLLTAYATARRQSGMTPAASSTERIKERIKATR